MSKNQKKKTFTIDIHCSKCNTLLYKYHKYGPGSLVKCYISRIVKDYAKGKLACPKCQTLFARFAIIHNKPANKLIRGKFYIKGHIKK